MVNKKSKSLKIAKKFLGKEVEIIIDRPMGSQHPKHGFIYEVNYGYLPNIKAPDGEDLDAYYLGINEPIEKGVGIVKAIIHRFNDDDDKLVVMPKTIDINNNTIEELVAFQEKWFSHKIIKFESIITKIKKVLIFILMIGIFGLGFYSFNQKNLFLNWKNNIINFYNNLDKKIEGLKKVNVGQIVSQVQKQVFTPNPLNIGGVEKGITLLQGKIIAETNLQRKNNGSLPALKENLKLNKAAEAKANDLFENQYFEHTSLSGVSPGELVQNYGYEYIITGENLILGNFSSEKELVQKWMDSEGHRENILNNRYTEIGVAIIKGIYKGESVWIGVQEFGLPLSACLEPNIELKNKIDSDSKQLNILSLQIDELKIKIDNTNPRSLIYKKLAEDYNNLVKQYNSLAEFLRELISQYNNQINQFNNCVAGK